MNLSIFGKRQAIAMCLFQAGTSLTHETCEGQLPVVSECSHPKLACIASKAHLPGENMQTRRDPGFKRLSMYMYIYIYIHDTPLISGDFPSLNCPVPPLRLVDSVRYVNVMYTIYRLPRVDDRNGHIPPEYSRHELRRRPQALKNPYSPNQL